MVVPAGGGGTFLGGYMVKKLNMRCRGIVRFCVMCTLMSLATIFIFLIHCPDLPMAGITAPYRSGLTEAQQQDQYQQLYNHPGKLRSRNRSAASSQAADEDEVCSSSRPLFLPHVRSSALEDNLTAACNAGCGCVREVYNPVCGADAMMYYSPCHAGCRSINRTEASTAKRVRGKEPLQLTQDQ